MTREEAINVLNDYDINFERNTAKEVAEAHEMAIKALEQQPSENEKIIRISKGTLKARTSKYVIYDVEWLKEHFNTTEAKIYGQPSEDCISRKAVLDGLANIAKAKSKSDAQKSLMGRVMFFTEHLPSVTPQSKEEPQQKTGHWIEHKHGGIEHIECSECGVWFLKANLIRKSYCPNCGSCNGDMIKNIMRDIANNNGDAK